MKVLKNHKKIKKNVALTRHNVTQGGMLLIVFFSKSTMSCIRKAEHNAMWESIKKWNVTQVGILCMVIF